MGPDRLDHRRVLVVAGPRTRLGRQLVARATARGEDVVVLARHERDARALAGGAARVCLPGRDEPSSATRGLVDSDAVRVRVVVCALGPVHPADAEPGGSELDAGTLGEQVAHEVDVLAQVLDGLPAGSAEVVLISSVLALAPRRDRRHYAGWKNVVEAELDRLVHRHPAAASLAVLYPGRLLDADERTRPWHRLHTTYEALATRVERTPAGAGAVVGTDARILLALSSTSRASRSLSRGRGATKQVIEAPAAPPAR